MPAEVRYALHVWRRLMFSAVKEHRGVAIGLLLFLRS